MLLELIFLAFASYYVVQLHRQNKAEGGPGVPIVGDFIDRMLEGAAAPAEAEPDVARFELSCSTAKSGRSGIIEIQMAPPREPVAHRRHHSRHRSKPSSKPSTSKRL